VIAVQTNIQMKRNPSGVAEAVLIGNEHLQSWCVGERRARSARSKKWLEHPRDIGRPNPLIKKDG
jgi:hypothetical protein